MFAKLKSKIIQFPKVKQQAAPAESNVLAELKASLKNVTPEPSPGNTAITPEQPPPVAITGSSAQIVTNHGTINHYHIESLPTPVKPVDGTGTINSQQKHQLRRLRDEIVQITADCGLNKHPATVMVGLNTYMGVAKYDQIPSDDFEKARARLQSQRDAVAAYGLYNQQRAELRRQMIDAIKVHHEERGRKSAIFQIITTKLSDDPALELSTTQLEELYKTVMSEK